MADKLKSEKIAAAKKRLKQFQSQQQESTQSESINVTEAAAVAPIKVSPVFSDTVAQYDSSHGDTEYGGPTVTFDAYFPSTPIQQQQSFPPPPPPLEQQPYFDMSSTDNVTHDIVPQANDHDDVIVQSEHDHPLGTLKRSADLSTQIAQLEAQHEQELAVERQRNSELNIQLRSQHGQYEALQNEMQSLRVAAATKSTMELGPLQEQLRSHVQTIGVLVGEKAELAAGLHKFQGLAKQKCEEVEELQGRLNASRHRVQVLEKEMVDVRQSREQYTSGQERLCSELETSQEQLRALQKRVDDASDDIAELNQMLSLKNKDIDRLEVELTAARSEISLMNLRVQQFSAGDSLESDRNVEQLTQQKLHFEQLNQDLQKMVQQLGTERDQTNAQYQSYVQQLNKDSTALANQLQEYVTENERLSKREQSLVKHVGDLERQIQQQMAKQKSFNKEVHVANDVNAGAAAEMSLLDARCATLEAEKLQLQQHLQENVQAVQSLQLQLQQKQQAIVDLESTIEMLHSQGPADAQRLIASMESDKVAASRAVSQNQELKQQLDEIQRAFVQVSNDKLELTDRLQSEQHLGKENKLKAGSLDVEVSNIKEKLHYKDEEMIRLTHENDDLSKQILQLSQELDRLRHYEAKGQSSNALQQQLQAANDAQRMLRQRVKQLEQSAAAATVAAAAEGVTTNTADLETPAATTTDTSDGPKLDMADGDDTISVTTSTVNMATEEAMEKLQERFTKTMLEIADLTEEKNRLEHLVTQLQGETETIGEYIALYQKQRRLLKQRELEKDVQLQQIVHDREEMREKLQQLNALVEQLLLAPRKPAIDVSAVQELANQHNHNGAANADEWGEKEQLVSGREDVVDDNIQKKSGADGADTAVRILNLLSEIQDRNQNQTYTDTPSTEVHNCAYCYGKLETV